jgi:hypothetical protein
MKEFTITPKNVTPRVCWKGWATMGNNLEADDYGGTIEDKNKILGFITGINNAIKQLMLYIV